MDHAVRNVITATMSVGRRSVRTDIQSHFTQKADDELLIVIKVSLHRIAPDIKDAMNSTN